MINDSVFRRWPVQLGVGALVTVFFASQVYVWVNLWPMKVSWWAALLWSIPQLLTWGLTIPLVLWLTRRWPIEGSHRGLKVLLHLVLSAGYALAVLLLLDLSDSLLRWSHLMGAPGFLVADISKTIIYLHNGIALYWVVLAVDHAVRYYGEVKARELQASRLAAQLAESELTALRMQLQPHFLFNTLNSIAVLIRNRPAEAESMVHRLSDFLRVTVDGSADQEVPLYQELDFLRSYLAIEEARFGDRLTVHFQVDGQIDSALVPSLILQPLVENAIRYAVAPRRGPAAVGISGRRKDGTVELEVWDDGPGMTGPEYSRREGVGLGNTRQRLATLYGVEQGMVVGNRSPEGLSVKLWLPYRTAGDEESPDASSADQTMEGKW